MPRALAVLCLLAFGFTGTSCAQPDETAEANPALSSREPYGRANGPSQWALVIGIDDYLSAGQGRSSDKAGLASSGGRQWRNLEGAVRDAEAFRDLLLQRFAFRDEGIHLLLNDQASRAGILAGIEWLTQHARPGEEIVFYYAGHGSQVWDPDGREEDHKDESLVPWDAIRGQKDLPDKELRRLFNRILDRGARLTLVVDSCHSGSVVRGLPIESRVRALEPIAQPLPSGDPGPQLSERGALILAASQPFERALETRDEKNQPRGAFSLALTRTLIQMGDEPVELLYQSLEGQLGSIQHPVLDSGDERRRQALLGATKNRGVRSRPLVAVEKVTEDYKVVLQGGYFNGLEEGSELEVATRQGRKVRLRVVGGVGPGQAEAVVVATGDQPIPDPQQRRRPATADIAPGALAERVGWVVKGRPALSVWISAAPLSWRKLTEFASELRRSVGAAGWQWVEDPSEQTPSHVLRWQEGHWALVTQGLVPKVEALSGQATPAEVVARLPPRPGRLFLHLPVSSEFARRLELGTESVNSAVERTAGPNGAQYHLVTRLSAAGLELAWVAPGRDVQSEGSVSLPVRTAWEGLDRTDRDGDPEATLAWRLEDQALQLGKIRLWLELQSPPDSRFPYHLALHRQGEDRLRRSGIVFEDERYGLVLQGSRAELALPIQGRYVYVFSLDSHGATKLLFPLDVNETLLPPSRTDGQGYPEEIPIGQQPLFRVAPPFGSDTYFLLTSVAPLSNPWVLERSGVRGRGPAGSTPLEELLSSWGSSTRGADLLVSSDWTIEKMRFESRPAQVGKRKESKP